MVFRMDMESIWFSVVDIGINMVFLRKTGANIYARNPGSQAKSPDKIYRNLRFKIIRAGLPAATGLPAAICHPASKDRMR